MGKIKNGKNIALCWLVYRKSKFILVLCYTIRQDKVNTFPTIGKYISRSDLDTFTSPKYP